MTRGLGRPREMLFDVERLLAVQVLHLEARPQEVAPHLQGEAPPIAGDHGLELCDGAGVTVDSQVQILVNVDEPIDLHTGRDRVWDGGDEGY